MSTKQEMENEIETLRSQVNILNQTLESANSQLVSSRRESKHLWEMYQTDTEALRKRIQMDNASAKKIIDELITESVNFVMHLDQKHAMELTLKVEQTRTDVMAQCFDRTLAQLKG